MREGLILFHAEKEAKQTSAAISNLQRKLAEISIQHEQVSNPDDANYHTQNMAEIKTRIDQLMKMSAAPSVQPDIQIIRK